ncbi:MAG: OmcA/MtrC family decaheme c-type cytochrome [Acidobacteria bacterium]|nr:OmcA/MtrC family decaheme c-type cytochrome [Acidobacteriota bacterium]
MAGRVHSHFEMRISDTRAVRVCLAASIVLAGAVGLSSATRKAGFTPREKAYYASPDQVNFVRPGFNITIVSAKVAADGTASIDFKITDSKGLGLDRLGVTSPGSVTLGFLLGYIPAGQKQFVTYATRTRTSTDGKNQVVQSTSDSGGTYTQVADGEYVYTYGVKAPSGWDKTASHRFAIYGNRNLTEFDMGTNYDDAFVDLVPGGGTPAPRDVVRTPACNSCHDQLAFHGGSRRSVEVCIICHTPNLQDPNGPTADFKVMIHKIHAGSALPSVQAGGTYNIGSSDWSSVVFPSDVRRCASCHDPKSGAAQANAWYTNPSRAACGSCHDDVNFATGQNHVNLPQVSDNQCADCHIPKGETEFDASIQGAHILPQEAPSRPGIVVTLVKVDNGVAGKTPTVTFTLKDFSGNPIPMSTMQASSTNRLALNMAGPTTDYGTTNFGSDVTTPGYVSESALSAAQCGADGTCTYTFKHAVPADAKGTFAIGSEARRVYTVAPGTVNQADTRYGADNKVIYFSVDGSPIVPRRHVVDISKCNGCHTRLSMHGENRNNTEYCVFCHNPSNSSGTGSAAVPIDLSVMVHKIHFGDNMQALGTTYKIGSSDFSDVRYPAFGPTGNPGNTMDCTMCHVNGSEAVFPIGKNNVKYPNGLQDPMPATTAACTACHQSRSAMAHAASQTDAKMGESCDVCHAADADFAISKVHAQ